MFTEFHLSVLKINTIHEIVISAGFFPEHLHEGLENLRVNFIMNIQGRSNATFGNSRQ